MRILHITEALGGGVLNVIIQLAKTQAADGHDVYVVHSTRPDTPCDHDLNLLFPAPVKRFEISMATNISPIKDVRGILAIMKTIRRLKPDAVHLHSSKAGVLGRAACKFLGLDKICFYTPHGFSFLRKDLSPAKRTIFEKIERLTSLFGGTTIACSQSELEHTLKKTGQKKAILIENSIPVDLVKKSSGGSSLCQIVTSGRLCNQKNPSGFRDIAVALKKIPAEFLWIGGGDLIHELQVDNRLPENLKCTGWITRNEVASLLHLSDIFVMTSLWEGMPLSLIEAQASGLPAVVLNVEGCKDIVINGVTGFVCNNVTDMASKLERLIRDTKLRAQLGTAAREIALQRYSEDRMHIQTIEAYKGILQATPI